MLKLVIITGKNLQTATDRNHLPADPDSEELLQSFVVTHASAQSRSSAIFGQLSSDTDSPVQDLVKLLLMHPCFRKSTGLLDFIYSDMLDLIGLDPGTVNRVAAAFDHADVMVLSVTDSLKQYSVANLKLQVTGYFEIKLHNNCKSLIKKAMVNLIRQPELKWERRVAL